MLKVQFNSSLRYLAKNIDVINHQDHFQFKQITKLFGTLYKLNVLTTVLTTVLTNLNYNILYTTHINSEHFEERQHSLKKILVSQHIWYCQTLLYSYHESKTYAKHWHYQLSSSIHKHQKVSKYTKYKIISATMKLVYMNQAV